MSPFMVVLIALAVAYGLPAVLRLIEQELVAASIASFRRGVLWLAVGYGIRGLVVTLALWEVTSVPHQGLHAILIATASLLAAGCTWVVLRPVVNAGWRWIDLALAQLSRRLTGVGVIVERKNLVVDRPGAHFDLRFLWMRHAEM
jgi:hypothetical protein